MEKSTKRQFQSVVVEDRSSLGHRVEHLDEVKVALGAAMKNIEQAKLRMTGYESNVGTHRHETVTDQAGVKKKLNAMQEVLSESMGLMDVEKDRITDNQKARGEMSTPKGQGHVLNGISEKKPAASLDAIARSLQEKSGQTQEKEQSQQHDIGR